MRTPMTAAAAARRPPWPDFRTVWRWHFYAGLFCIPFVVWLALTGSVYLWRPQVEAWLDRPYAHLAAAGRVAPSREVRAALAVLPGSALQSYQLPHTPDAAAQVLVGRGARLVRVWVDPRSGRVLKSTPEDARLMRVVFRLHGELLLGDRGSILVELAGSWAVVMVLTGLFLWWPRSATGPAGVLYPRLGRGRRLFWRDLHACAGLWVSGLTLLLLLSGLPWATSWGAYLKEVRHLAGLAAGGRDWTSGTGSELAARAATDGRVRAAAGPSGHAGHEGHMAGMDMGAAPAPPASAYDALDRAAPAAARLGFAFPVLVGPPLRPGGPWSVRSDAQDRPLRAEAALDPGTGAVLWRRGFGSRDWVDRTVGVGVAAHEGQLFGLANQLVNLFTALALLAVSASAVVLWRRRKPGGVLGAPLPTTPPRFSGVLLATMVALGLLLPLMGASLVATALVERLVLRRLPGVRDWLGLGTPAPRAG